VHRSTALTTTVRRAGKPAALLVVAAAALSIATPAAFAKGGGGPGTAPTPTPAPNPAACATVSVVNNGQIVRNQSMPAIKFNVQSCSSRSVATTITVTETSGVFSTVCPSPVAAPAPLLLAPTQKVALSAPVYRGACGMVSQTNPTIVWSPLAWQGHNLLVTITDDATGVVLSSAPFSWSDTPPKGV